MVTKMAVFSISKLSDQHRNIKLHPQVRDFCQQMTFSGPNKKRVTTIIITQLMKPSKEKEKKSAKGRVTAGE